MFQLKFHQNFSLSHNPGMFYSDLEETRDSCGSGPEINESIGDATGINENPEGAVLSAFPNPVCYYNETSGLNECAGWPRWIKPYGNMIIISYCD
jgi:hypothetical protein